MIWPAQCAADAAPDLNVQIVQPDERSIPLRVNPNTGEVVSEHFPEDAEVVVLQRPTNRFMPGLIPLLQQRGVTVVVEMDDDLSDIDGRNPAFQMMRPWTKIPEPVKGGLQFKERRLQNMHSFHNAAEACRLADLVTVTTPRLARVYGAHGRVAILPNYVPEAFLRIDHEDSDLVGWGGSVHSHPDDLQQVGPSVAALVRAGMRFETVGDRDGVGRALGLGEDPPGPGPVGLAEWPKTLARFGVGIAPLAPTKFNDAKSWLKPMEYAALGIPAVISPAADYLAWAELGDHCVVARRPKEWRRALQELTRDGARRREMSEEGRMVAADHTIEGNGWRWAEAWAMARRETKVRAGAK